MGYARYAKEYNANGYLEEVKYFDKTGNPVFVKSQGHAAIKYKYDARGNIVECVQLDVKGQLAIIRYKYNERDNQTEIAYYDRNDMPDNSEGYFKMINVYNERNQIVEWRYYNSAGKLAPVVDNAGKFALLKNEYLYAEQ